MLTLQQFWHRSAKESFRIRYSPRLFQQYVVSMEQYILPRLGGYPAADITSAHIRRFTSDLIRSEGLAINTVRGLYSILRSLFRCANAAGILRKDPMEGMTAPAAVRWYTALSSAQLQTVLPCLRESRFCNAYFLILYTGLSPSELFGIRRSRFDEAAGRLTIDTFVREPRRSASHAPNEETRHCIRTIPLSVQAMDCLLRQREAAYADGDLSEDRYLFCGTAGAPPGYQHAMKLRTDSRLIAEKTGIQGFGALMLRNTFMQLALSSGTTPKVLQDYMGFRHLPFVVFHTHADIAEVSDALGRYYHEVDTEEGSL